jgi:hypothetical protein
MEEGELIESSGRHVLRAGNTTPVASDRSPKQWESNVLESGSHRGGCQVSSGPRLHFCSQCTPHAATVAEEREKNERVGGQGRVGHRSSVIA